jgi:dipeptidyl-peptidase-4
MKIRHLIAFRTVVIVLSVAAPVAVRAQGTRDDYVRAEQFLPWNVSKTIFKIAVKPNWIEGGNRFWYRNDTRAGKEFILVDPARNVRQPAFDHTRLAAALSTASNSAYEHHKLPFETITFVEGGKALQFDVGKMRWTCTLDSYKCSSAGKPDDPAPNEARSPDGKWAAFTREHNLYLKEVATGQETQLTRDGERYYDYASTPDSGLSVVSDIVAGRKLPPEVIWSADSRRLVTFKLDQRRVADMHLIQMVPPAGWGRPIHYSYRYPLPGDKEVALAEYWVFDAEKKSGTKLAVEPDIVTFRTPLSFKWIWWSDDNQSVYLIRHERGFKSIKLNVADASTGLSRTILEEKGPNYVDPYIVIGSPKVRTLGKSSELLWLSERDGWAHLYLYDTKTGAVKNQITSGPWVVRQIEYVDEANRLLYFTAGGREEGRDPYYPHFYRVKLDGTGLQLLTAEDAAHNVRLSADHKFFVDTYSRADMPPISVLRSIDGTTVRELEKADIELLQQTGWRFPERFCVKAHDGVTDIYGLIFKPTNFDPAKKYPVLDSIYPGPQVIRTPKTFENTLLEPLFADHQQSLAELGFIVITIDGLGQPDRSKAFHDVSYNNMQSGGALDDHIAGFMQLAATRPYLDLNRVGIYGHSGGGFASTRAILMYPDFYKVAVSSAGNHDQRGYSANWGERYQGLLDGDNYRDQANISLVKNLKGKLLLAYGDMDDNVHPALTVQVIHALIEANKDFDMLVMPNRNHGTSLTDPYFIRKRWDYFVKNLLGVEPPAGYQIKTGS